jgi:hypothetical protein
MSHIRKSLGVAALLATTALASNAWAGTGTNVGGAIGGGFVGGSGGTGGPTCNFGTTNCTPTVTVPEPGALELLVGGVAVGIAALRLRRRK